MRGRRRDDGRAKRGPGPAAFGALVWSGAALMSATLAAEPGAEAEAPEVAPEVAPEAELEAAPIEAAPKALEPEVFGRWEVWPPGEQFGRVVAHAESEAGRWRVSAAGWTRRPDRAVFQGQARALGPAERGVVVVGERIELGVGGALACLEGCRVVIQGRWALEAEGVQVDLDTGRVAWRQVGHGESKSMEQARPE